MSIAYTILFGKPLIFWGGITGFLFLLTTAITGNTKIRFKLGLSVRVHHTLAYITVAIAAIHGFLAITGI